jgi:PhzF family phenazine biosynthesis protein
MTPHLAIFHVDAFTDRPFAGNPAAVCILDRERGDPWLASVAAEMNLSETAFLLREGSAWRLRWFTPSGRPSRSCAASSSSRRTER